MYNRFEAPRPAISPAPRRRVLRRDGGELPRTRLNNGRKEELLDRVMRIAAAEGFAELKMADLARELHCSVATLYKLAPSKIDLVIVALERWGEQLLTTIDARARECTTPSARARAYYREGADGLRELSSAFRRDVERFEGTRRAYREIISDRFIERFSALLEEAAQAGEIRPVNVPFAVGMFRYIAVAVRDQDLLDRAGLTAREALLEVDTMIWDGVQYGAARKADAR
jgi:AcrR family transcriptional regulator